MEFYDPDEDEPQCAANPASYEMKFTGKWSETCHPGSAMAVLPVALLLCVVKGVDVNSLCIT